MAKETKKKEPKQKYGDYNNDGTVDSVSAFLTDISDGGGRGGSGTSYSNLNHNDYLAAGGGVWGKDGSGDQSPSGWTNYDRSGRGQTQSQSPFMRNFGGAAFGLLTGGPAGMVTSLIGQKIREDMQRKRGLLDAVQVGNPKDPMGLLDKNKQAIAPTIQVASPYAAEDLAMSQEVLPYGPQPMPLSTMGQIPPDIMATTINPAGVPFNNIDGAIGALGSKVMPNASNGMPPSGMSDQMYSSWLRNQRGDVNVDNMTPEGLRYMYENYRNSPAFK